MFQFEQNADIVGDKEDLLTILRMRFGDINPGVIETIYDLDELESLERLILVAVNAPTLKIFLEELGEGPGSFRIMGERFNPIDSMLEGSGLSDEENE